MVSEGYFVLIILIQMIQNDSSFSSGQTRTLTNLTSRDGRMFIIVIQNYKFRIFFNFIIIIHRFWVEKFLNIIFPILSTYTLVCLSFGVQKFRTFAFLANMAIPKISDYRIMKPILIWPMWPFILFKIGEYRPKVTLRTWRFVVDSNH